MTTLDIVVRYPNLVVAGYTLAAMVVGAVLMAITQRAFLWPRYVREHRDEWAKHDIAELELENKDLKRQLRVRKQITRDLQHRFRMVTAGMAGMGDLEDFDDESM